LFIFHDFQAGKIQIYQNLTRVFEIDSRSCINHGLDLAEAPLWFIGHANELTRHQCGESGRSHSNDPPGKTEVF